MGYKVTFNWSGPDYDRGKLQAVSCDGQDIPPDETWQSEVAAEAVQFRKDEAYHACLTVNSSQTLQLHKNRFLYLDVGLWLRGQQTFGAVCGHEAVLCRYEPGAATQLSTHRYQEFLLNTFLRHLKGISVINRMPIPNPHPKNPDHLWVILPDMHVPEAPSAAFQPPPMAPGPPAPPPYELEELHHSRRNPAYDQYLRDEQARKKQYFADNPNYSIYYECCKRDSIFDSRLSIAAMCSFLGQVRTFESPSNISLVQVGDMYELWAGRPCLFESTPAKFQYVDLAHDLNRSEPDLANEVGRWVGGTHLLWPELFRGFDACKAAGIDTSFLHGNHDSYMILPEIVDAANRYIVDCVSKGVVDRLPADWVRSPEMTKVHRRRRPKIEDGTFIEHGQRVDAYNRDGSREGHEMTQKAVGDPSEQSKWRDFKKKFDPTRRNTFVYGAASSWLRSGGQFGLYVQGHTHAPVLEQVEVYHSREDIKEVMTSKGGRVPVPVKAPLDVGP